MATPASLFHARKRRRALVNRLFPAHFDLQTDWAAVSLAAIAGAQTFSLGLNILSAVELTFTGARLPMVLLGNKYQFTGLVRLNSMIAGVEPYPFRVVYDDGGSLSPLEQTRSLTVAGDMVPFKLPFVVQATGGKIQLRSNDAAKSANLEVVRLAVTPIWPS